MERQEQLITSNDTHQFQNQQIYYDDNSDESLQKMQSIIKFCNKQLYNPQLTFQSSYKQMLQILSQKSDKAKLQAKKIIKYNIKNVEAIDFSKYQKFLDTNNEFNVNSHQQQICQPPPQEFQNKTEEIEEMNRTQLQIHSYNDKDIKENFLQIQIEYQEDIIQSDIVDQLYFLNYQKQYEDQYVFYQQIFQNPNLFKDLQIFIDKQIDNKQQRIEMFKINLIDHEEFYSQNQQQFYDFQEFQNNLQARLQEIQYFENLKYLQDETIFIELQLKKIIEYIQQCDLEQINEKDFQKFIQHINYQDFQNCLKKKQQLDLIKSSVSQFIFQLSNESKKINDVIDSFKKSDYIPYELELQKQKIQNLKQFFIKQLQELFDLTNSEEINLIDKLFSVYLFVKEIEWELQFFQKRLFSYSTKPVIQEKMYDSKSSGLYLLMGATGSGKTTQIPQMLFSLNNYYQKQMQINKDTVQKKILCIQPRRIACTTLYQRMKFEMQNYGKHVGYYIGNLPTQQNYINSCIIFVTEQVFINLFVNFLKGEKKSLISQCSHIIVDEVHERNLKTDIIIGLINRYLSNKNRVKYNINFLFSSATINQEIFQRYFDHIGIDIIEIKGHVYPVKVQYIDNSDMNTPLRALILNQIEKIIDLNKQSTGIQQEVEGHILIFLQDQIEINQLVEETKKLTQSNSNFLKIYEIHQLHGKLSSIEQQKVFEENEYVTKIIFSTNIAEASITIENVSIVIDTGLEKTMIFDPTRNSSVATVQNISKSQADQRKGRAGRTRSGICYRLYTEQQFKEFKQDKEPEIVRSNLGYAILKIIELGVQNISEFQFLSQPSNDLINNSLDTLQTINAINVDNGQCKLSQIGQCIIQTQLEPIIARILIKAYYLQVLDEVMKVLSVYTEYNFIFCNQLKSKDLLIKIFKYIEDEQQTKSNKIINQNSQISDPPQYQKSRQSSQIDEKNSDFLFMWRTYEYLENEISNNYQQKREHGSFLKVAYKKISEYYNDLKHCFDNLIKFIKKQKQKNYHDEELMSIQNQIQNQKDNMDQNKKQELTSQQIKINIVQSLFIGYSKQIAVYTGIHKLGFNNVQSNIMFYVHPSSSLNIGANLNNKQNQSNIRQFQKGDTVFFSILEEREINNFAKCVSFFDPSWIDDSFLKQQIEIKSKFEPHTILNGEKSLLEYFFRNQFQSISENLKNYNRNDESKKAKYFVNFDKDYGKFQLYCNEEMKNYINSLNIQQIFEISKEQYQKQLKKEQSIVRYKDSFNFAIVKSGLQIKQIILPHQFLQVNIIDIPFKCKENQIFTALKNENLEKIRYQEFLINNNYVEQTSCAQFKFKNTKSAYSFYQSLQSIDMNKFANQLQSNKIPQIIPVPECNYYIESIKNLSKCIVRAQWSITPSLCMGQLFFNNDTDAYATFEQLKRSKQFKVRFEQKYDSISDSNVYIIQVDRLDKYVDEVDLDAYVVNGYSGFISAQIKREKMDESFLRNLSIEESLQKQKLKSLIEDSPIFQSNQKKANNQNPLNQQNNNDTLQIWMRIQKGVCKAEIMLDSEVMAKEIVDKFNGLEFGCQKLRLQIQNYQKIPILGAVYKFYYEDIKQFIREADQMVQAKLPELSSVIINSKNVILMIKQVKQNGNIVFSRLLYQIKNIIKPDVIYLDCFPEDLEKVMEAQYKLIQSLEKQFNCVLKQQSKRKPELKVWFKKESTSRFLKDAKKQIKNALNDHLKQKFHIQKTNYQFKLVDSYLSSLKQKKEIDYDFDNKKITIKATKSQITKIKLELNDPNKNYLLYSYNQKQDTCQICQEIKNLERLSCDCLFCKECIYQFFLTQSQDKQKDKPLACPNHQDLPVSLKIINSVFDQQQIAEIVQIRIDNSIENLLHPTINKQIYIRCPSVNCNEFFERIFQESTQTQSPKELQDEIEKEEEEQKEQTIIQNKLVSKKFKSNLIPPPSIVKCYGCFQEYCLLSSGKDLEKIEELIHQAHVQKTCEEYFKDLELEQDNIKDINILQCPKCKIKATKGGGCNHIACRCGAHFCAKCLEQFFSAKDVYTHLSNAHDGIFD